MFLGLLCPIEDFQVYGYVTNTKIKLIAVLEDIKVRDADVKVVRPGCRAPCPILACPPHTAPAPPATSSSALPHPVPMPVHGALPPAVRRHDVQSFR